MVNYFLGKIKQTLNQAAQNSCARVEIFSWKNIPNTVHKYFLGKEHKIKFLISTWKKVPKTVPEYFLGKRAHNFFLENHTEYSA